MDKNERFRTAAEYMEWLRVAQHERKLPANDCTRAAVPCFGIAQDHHHAIVVLLRNRLYASCFALVRVAFEAYIRGEWLATCATDAELQRFLQNHEPPPLNCLIAKIEEKPDFSHGVLSAIKRQHWSSMCAYTHTGGLHVQRWITADAIEPSYTPEEIQEVLFFAELIATMAALGFADLAADEALAKSIAIHFQARSQA